jgi:hypothetical protein
MRCPVELGLITSWSVKSRFDQLSLKVPMKDVDWPLSKSLYLINSKTLHCYVELASIEERND